MDISIYNKVDKTSTKWLDDNTLKYILENGLRDYSTGIQPIRRRKKLFKIKVCEILGFPPPKTFIKNIKPDFPMYDFDLYVQQSHNLQIWNQNVSPERRYVIIKIDDYGRTLSIKIINGKELSKFDTTGKITTKLQAKLDINNISTKLATNKDTDYLIRLVKSESLNILENPNSSPKKYELLPISEIFNKLLPITSGLYNFKDVKSDRQRGDIVHKICSGLLGYKIYGDNGQFPDIKNQLLEIKLQTSPTIDIGLESPDSDKINMKISKEYDIKNKDVRYAIVYANIENDIVNIKNLIVVNGENFYKIFPQMQGNVINSKIQLSLPNDFFND